MENHELKELKQRLESLPTLDKRFRALNDVIKETNSQIVKLLIEFEKEKLDVEKIRKDSLTTMLIKLTGTYDKRLEKEEREEIEAKLRYDKALERHRQLEEDHHELSQRIRALKKEQETYKDELDRRERLLKNHFEGVAGDKYREQEEKAKELVREQVEIKEALAVGRRVINVISIIQGHLSSAQGWATYDAFTKGGIISHMIKYDHLDNAASEFHRLSSLLEDFKKELKDVEHFNIPVNTGISSGTRAVDFWLDNIFTDLSVRSKIISDKEQVDSLERQINEAMEDLNKAEREVRAQLNKAEFIKEELVINL